MDGVDSLHTARLVGRPLKEVDFSDLRILHSNPDVMATLGGVRSPEQTEAFLKRSREHWQQNGFGLWAFRDKHSMEFVGRGGLRKASLEHGEEVELTYALSRDYWGKGFASEMALASIEIAFDVLYFPHIVALILEDNTASKKVIARAGFRYERDVLWNERPHQLYRLTRQGWDSLDPSHY